MKMFDNKKVKYFMIFYIIILSSYVIADGGFFKFDSYRNEDLYEPEQKAIIIHENNLETLILQVSAQGNISNFVWIIPTPTYPNVEKGNSELFSDLHYITRPKTIQTISLFLLMPISKLSAGFLGVNIHEQKAVGMFNVSILSSNNSNSLITWLNNNSYHIPESANEVLNYYIDNDWYFIAMKVDKNNNELLQDLKKIDDKIYDKNSAIDLYGKYIFQSIKNNNAKLNITIKKKNDYDHIEIFSNKDYEKINQFYTYSDSIFLDKYINVNVKSHGGTSLGGLFFGIDFYNGNFRTRESHNYLDFFKKNGPVSIEKVEKILDKEIDDNGVENFYEMGITTNEEAQNREKKQKSIKNKLESELTTQLFTNIKSNTSFDDTYWKQLIDKSKIKNQQHIKDFYEQFLNDYYNRDQLIKDEINSKLTRSLYNYNNDFTEKIHGKENLRLLTPIQINFESEEIIYPLKISSINKGDTEILLYVITKYKTHIQKFKLEYANYFSSIKNKESLNKNINSIIDLNDEYYISKHRLKIKNSEINGDLTIHKAENNEPYRMKVFEKGLIKWSLYSIISILFFYGWILLMGLISKGIFNQFVHDKNSPYYFSKLKLFIYPISYGILHLLSYIFDLLNLNYISEKLMIIFLITTTIPPIIGTVLFLIVIHFIVSFIINIIYKN